MRREERPLALGEFEVSVEEQSEVGKEQPLPSVKMFDAVEGATSSPRRNSCERLIDAAADAILVERKPVLEDVGMFSMAIAIECEVYGLPGAMA